VPQLINSLFTLWLEHDRGHDYQKLKHGGAMSEVNVSADLNELQRDLLGLRMALESLYGNTTEIPINPNDRASVENAIRQMEAAVDRKVAAFNSNKMVTVVIKAAKDEYRNVLRKRFVRLESSLVSRGAGENPARH
jgi:hypothetical protein